MAGRGRRLPVVFLVAAAGLAVGHRLSVFLAERIWEADVAPLVAAAGLRRALIDAGIEAAVIAVAAGWLLLHFSIAARTALPFRPAPEREGFGWPRTIPRSVIPISAALLGYLIGVGAGRLADPLRLMLDGAQVGLRDPFLEEDLATYVGSFPVWSGLQSRAVLLSLVALIGVTFLFVLGGLITRSGRRIGVSPRARGQLAILLSIFAVVLAWGTSLEPLRLAAGLRGPIRHSEFLLQAMMSYLQSGVGAAAAVVSLLWWVRIRGAVALLFWLLFLVARFGSELLPLHPDLAAADPVWRTEARRLDSVAFRIGVTGYDRARLPALAALIPTLWDDSVAARAGLGSFPHRSWLHPGTPVWLGLRDTPAGAGVTVMADDRVSPSGAPLFWQAGAAGPFIGLRTYRPIRPAGLAIHSGAPRVVVFHDSLAPGPKAAGWGRRLLLAWAWQSFPVLEANPGTRVGWRLDPLVRLQSIAGFAHWSAPRLRLLDSAWVWQSDGLLVSDRFPSSGAIPWGGGSASMVHSAFLGVVDAGSGVVRIFQRDEADSLASAWARVHRPLIEPAGIIPPELRAGEAYPIELAHAQARVLAGPAWNAGILEPGRGGQVSEAPGGSERVVTLIRPGSQLLAAMVLLRRTPTGDSVWLVPLDSMPPIEAAGLIAQRWERFPFQQMLRDSILAAGAAFRTGAVRYALTAEGPVAYQPAWSEGPAARPRLALVNVALGSHLGTGRSFEEAWQNLRGEISPSPVGAGPQAILDGVRRWWQSADSALKRRDLDALGRALAQLRELLERQPD